MKGSRMSDDHPISAPRAQQDEQILIVAIDDGESIHKYGVDTEFLPIDDVQMWTHEFSERTLHELTHGGCLPIAITTLPGAILFRIHHLLVSLHTPSILRIVDESGTTLRRQVLQPEEFADVIRWRTTSHRDPT
jgi:hypothetical protein